MGFQQLSDEYLLQTDLEVNMWDGPNQE